MSEISDLRGREKGDIVELVPTSYLLLACLLHFFICTGTNRSIQYLQGRVSVAACYQYARPGWTDRPIGW